MPFSKKTFLLSSSVKTFEEKLKITLLGSYEELLGLTSQRGIRSHNFFSCVYLHLMIDTSLLLIIILKT